MTADNYYIHSDYLFDVDAGLCIYALFNNIQFHWGKSGMVKKKNKSSVNNWQSLSSKVI